MHRGSIRGISIPQLGLGIVAIAAVAVAVLIGPRGAPAPDDAVGAREPTPLVTDGTTTAPSSGRLPASRPSAAASVAAGGGTTSPPGGRGVVLAPPRPATVRVASTANPAWAGSRTGSTSGTASTAGTSGTASTAGTGSPAMTVVATSGPNHAPTPAPPDRGSSADSVVVVRIPPIDLPSCLVDC
ncbi:hypothetical protein [Frankia gtarii]|uniref:hypothetical protein n=1 Tax=Frankia gtarii TaxID=2950102 RepID=UPI0021C18B88|nr:hypothetical protein [Frankia gtarii]